ncbi:MAG TPA: NAD(P)H-hydrate dehydratase, partial [Actinomycetaceae bacterium]|nr:NAD(P)H-hydrate dehydratase [Actinomycetaceae bacterium]
MTTPGPAAYAAEEIEAAERPLLDRGATDALMKRAAFGLAVAVRRAMRRHGLARDAGILLLVGAGNNGGDALYAGAVLAGWGRAVTAVLTAGRAHHRALRAAQRAGVRCHDGADATELAAAPVWVDGLSGIGVRPGPRPELAAVISRWEERRAAQLPLVIAVDVPSGIGVDTGELPGPVLRADHTVTMGGLKPGLLMPPAALAAGEVDVVDLGLDLRGAAPVARRIDARAVARLIPRAQAHDHKYTRGVLGLLTGSRHYPGAAVLSAAGALATGIGMVRYEGPREAADLVLRAHPEVVLGAGRCQAWAMGSGVDPADEARAAEIRTAAATAQAEGTPLVLDAGAIQLAPAAMSPTTVLTPHAGELAALLSARGEPRSGEQVAARPADALRAAVRLTGATVLLKGAITLVCGPGTEIYAAGQATPWLASAGTGDVLTGVVGALLAGHRDRPVTPS